MKQLDKYLKLQSEIFDYFGYKEDWVAIPIDDCRDYFWRLNGGEGIDGEVIFHEKKKVVIESDGDHYAHPIYTQRFLPKWVYRGKDYTMICVDTQTDGNKFLSIFSNSKEVKT